MQMYIHVGCVCKKALLLSIELNRTPGGLEYDALPKYIPCAVYMHPIEKDTYSGTFAWSKHQTTELDSGTLCKVLRIFLSVSVSKPSAELQTCNSS